MGNETEIHMAPEAPLGPASLAGRKRMLWAFGLSAPLAALAATFANFPDGSVLQLLGLAGQSEVPETAISSEDKRKIAELNVDDRDQIVAEGASAQERNAAIPESRLPLEKVGKFALVGGDSPAYASALRCLTQAIYYEAAQEPIGGRRAVAQVVLNRVRHPAYPKSVCGVVYQGWQRWTGCQFSFTCDGSLIRTPMARPWKEAEQVARDALAGHVEKSVGTATHYHADYVLPKWAFQLGKIEQVGRHIFYRFNGSVGRSGSFNGRYSGIENIPAISLASLRERLRSRGPSEPMLATVSGLTVTPHVTDRHAENDVGGRLDTTREWRLAIPDPVEASSRYRQAIAEKPEMNAAAEIKREIAEVHPPVGPVLQ